METDVDSDGEDKEMIRKTLIEELLSILHEYPDDGQILKEMIQNAEDAGATVVKVLTDTRSFHRNMDDKELQDYPHLKFFQGPALCVYNDAQFTEEDWEGIRRLGTSIKEKDPLKVGRFGLGFKSVFHMTDRLVILSGQKMMSMDPFKPEHQFCNEKILTGRKGKLLTSLLRCLDGVFGVSKETFQQGSPGLPGTIFWFPLRQEGNELSSTVYDQGKVEQLMSSFKAEAPSLLLFLTNIQQVTISTRDDTHGPQQLFSVGLVESCRAHVSQKRKAFAAAIKEAGQDLPQEGCYCLAEVVMETVDSTTNQDAPAQPHPAENSQEDLNSQSWLVASYHPGQGDVSEELAQLCSNPQLCYRPHVGVAAPLTKRRDFQSQVFCFLPLPLDTRSPTGLPVHVHGYFALDQSRRHLKWPTGDQLDLAAGRMEPSLHWNCLLVRELLPHVYHTLLDRLRAMSRSNPGDYYAVWPDEAEVEDRWSCVLPPLYTALTAQPSFCSQAGHWLTLPQVVLEELSPDVLARLGPEGVAGEEGEEGEGVLGAVSRLYSAGGRELLRLPDHVRHTLQRLHLLEGTEVMTPAVAARLLPPALPHLSRPHRLHLLHFLACQDDCLELVRDQELIPLADGTFAAFKARGQQTEAQKEKSGSKASVVIRWSQDSLQQLFPGLEHEFCDNKVPAPLKDCLCKLARSGEFLLEELDEDHADIARLMERSLQLRFLDQQPAVPHHDAWTRNIWAFLADKELANFGHLTLLPLTRKDDVALLPLSGVYICSSVREATPLNPHLVSSLSKLGVCVLPELPDYVTRHKGVLGNLVHFPSPAGVMATLRLVNGNGSRLTIDKFNETSSTEEKEAVTAFLGESSLGDESPLGMFRCLKLFTEVSTGDAASVNQVSVIAPENLPPLKSQHRMLLCTSRQRCLASKLGAKEVTLLEIVTDIVKQLLNASVHFSDQDIVTFMKFVLCRVELIISRPLLDLLARVRFLLTLSGCLKMPRELYDPSSSTLRKLFAEEEKFPCDDFWSTKSLILLKELGLKGESSIDPSDIVRTSGLIEDFLKQKKDTIALEKADGLLEMLTNNGEQFNSDTLRQISSRKCLPCLHDGEKPDFYPKSLPYSSHEELAKPNEMCHSSLANLVGSVCPLLRGNLPPNVVGKLEMAYQAHTVMKKKKKKVVYEVNESLVLKNLDNVLSHFQQDEVRQYRFILGNIFHFLAQHASNLEVVELLAEKKCVLLEAGDDFAKPVEFWIERAKSDIQLKPYKHPLPSDFKEIELFEACGAAKHQDAGFLNEVLLEIQAYHSDQTRAQCECKRDMNFVIQILGVLSKEESADEGSVLLPVHHSQEDVLHFKQARDCTVVPSHELPFCDGDDEIVYVHKDIHQGTAIALGALKMKERALTDVENLGVDYGYGQHEELTTRLHTLLEESYTDGFSVPKELIQNADDAGATEVCFLLDERENEDARTNLIRDNMESLQGPAFWAYNDATFSDKDFENIIKLGAGTKKEDASKVGRFGLGFNAVYNLTDVPSFISRHTMAVLDPHTKHLGSGHGLKLDFRRKGIRNLLSRMPQQFKPFQDVFGCKLLSNENIDYDGTLFRFPLRTAEQAKESKIKAESYGHDKQRQFLQMLLEKAGSLLMFTQSVEVVKVFHLPRDSKNPSAAQCLLTVTKTSSSRQLKPEIPLGDQTLLQYCSSQWPTHSDIQIVQDIQIKMTVTQEAESVCQVQPHNSTSQWRLAWASGVDQSRSLVQRNPQKGLIPLAAVACLIEAGCLQSVEESPQGFYKSGHYFCFLPLPDITVPGIPHVHINATFALTSSRRGLLTSTEDDLGGEGAAWNSALLDDAVSRAYLLLLENVQTEAAAHPDFKPYFGLWPVSGETVLRSSILRRLVTDRHKVFPVLGEGVPWVAFTDAWFLEQQFRQQACGNIAWKAMQKFWKREGKLVDLPPELSSALAKSDQRERYQKRVISEIEFFQDSFFPHIDSSYWQQQDRDELVLHALLQDKPDLNELLMTSPCIPCAQLTTLHLPSELIHPQGEASTLFSLSDDRFPQGARRDKSQPITVDFCSDRSLNNLVKLDMIKDELPFKMLIERATSVEQLLDMSKESAKQRAKQLISYLSSYKNGSTRINQGSPEALDELSKVKFLPVLSKPEDWLLPWPAEASPDTLQLAVPSELWSEDLKHLVGCHKLLLDNKALDISIGTQMKLKTIELLGVRAKQDVASLEMFEIAVMQLRTVAKTTHESEDITPMSMHDLCVSVYSYLSKCCKKQQHERHAVLGALSHDSVVWTKTGFVDSSRVAMKLAFDCQPYRFQLETAFHPPTFFEEIGVKTTFDVDNLASLLEDVRNKHGENQLPDETVHLVARVGQQLCENLTSSGVSEETQIFLPDRHGYMRQTCHLCLDDCEWLEETENMKFISSEVPNWTASKLGVKSKRRNDLASLGEPITLGQPFGQSEKLTNRINRLLQGYTFDSSLFKELLQNADDAGATEIKFIKDWRQLGRKKIIEGCEPLQGPALCVFNDKNFSRKDMEGIQSLGRGSKGLDVLKTGQYGVGFNAVYHVTDAPSFWTREDGVHETICILDPNCQYVPDTAPHKPGIKLTNIKRIKEAYPDTFNGYLGSGVDMTQPGTLFRLPLRTEEMARKSEIKKTEVTKEEIEILLGEFQKEMSSCLLFLNNVRKIGIYKVTEKGKLVLEKDVEIDLKQSSLDTTEAFKQGLIRAASTLGDKKKNMTDIDSFESCSLKTIKQNNGHEEQWLIAQRIGFKNTRSISRELQKDWHKEHFQLLPRGGVAVRLPQRREGAESDVSAQPVTLPQGTARAGPDASAQSGYQAFCTLPLPVFTKLPVHVNGHFALDHETRRNLWDNTGEGKSDTRTEWNELIASQVIVPAYTTALQCVKERLFSSAEKMDSGQLSSKLKYYNSLFPDLDVNEATSQFWTSMIKKLYKQIAEAELAIFPVVNPVQGCLLEWHPVFSSHGFAGYFNNLKAYFKALPDTDKPRQPKNDVRLSGGVQQHGKTHDVSKWAEEKARTLKSLLIEVNMKVLEVPYRIFNNFQESGVEDMVAVSPESVAKFLKSAGSSTQEKCNVDNLPQPVSSTSIKTPANVAALLHFIQYKKALLDDLEGLPLCLRQSERLFTFHGVHDSCKPIASRFCDLLIGSADLFIHQEITGYFLPFPTTFLTWIKEFDIPTLVHLLPNKISEEHFKAGSPCLFPADCRTSSWLNRLWHFVDSKVSMSTLSKSDDVRKFVEGQLQGLLEWSLIPVTLSVEKVGGSKTTQERLYPVKNMHKVVFLSEEPDSSNRDVWQTLKALPLPFLNSSLMPFVGIVTSMVASIGHPLALLVALGSCAGTLHLECGQARSILKFFSRNLPGLKESLGVDKIKLQQILRRLPVFPGFGGKPKALSTSTSVMCLRDDVHSRGLEDWAAKRPKQLLLLRKSSLPETLRYFLDLEAPETATFYHHYLLPTLQYLPWAAIVDHMKVIKQGLRDPLWGADVKQYMIQQLHDVKFIKVDDELFSAGKFYSPHHPVFSMFLSERSPPAPYNEPCWKHFMKSAGMISEVTSEMFLHFAMLVRDEGKLHVSDFTAERSDTLVKHLFSFHVPEFDNGFYQKIKNIRFVRQSEWKRDREVLCRIAPPYCHDRLVCFAESCGEEHLFLVWTSCSILHQNADPKFQTDNENTRNVSNRLGLTQKAPLDKVMQHVKTVCQSLGEDVDKELLLYVKNVMVALYRHLQKHDNDTNNAILKQLTFIFDAENRKMLKPENVVIGLREHEAIKGHIAKAPHCLGKFFEFFEKLGTCQEVTADHYANVLLRVKHNAVEKVLHVEELKIVQIAVRELFICLKSDKPQIKQLTVESVYLPSESHILIKSSQLFFDDASTLGKRTSNVATGVLFFLGFKMLDIENMFPKRQLDLLPDKHQLKYLSEFAKHVIPNEVKQRREEGRHSRDVARKFCSRKFVKVVVRQACNLPLGDNSSEFTEETAIDISRRLSMISCFEVDDLHTITVWGTQPFPETESYKIAFCDNVSDGDGSCTVYLDRRHCDLEGIDSPTVIRVCATAVVDTVGLNGKHSIIEQALRSPDEAMMEMNEQGLEICNFKLKFSSRADRTVFPPAGTFIPLHYHCYLDNNIGNAFYIGEHVGYEVYDPQVDEISTDHNDPVYVYGIVVEEAKQEGNVTRFFQRYRIDLGKEMGIIEADVTQLYKFIRKTDQGPATPTEGPLDVDGNETSKVVPFSGERAVHGMGEAACTKSKPKPTLNFKEVMKEIKEMLEEAWKEKDEKILKRVMKRLYLKWHPDKNKDNQEFCTRVVQRLQHYIDFLRRGEKIPDEDDNKGSSHHQASSSEDFYSSFFENMSSRGRAYNEHFRNQSQGSRSSRSGFHEFHGFHGHDEDNREYHNSSYKKANPQPGEARRWFRQAEADLGFAQAARGTYKKGHNWVCFLCYQATEKALKALLYYKDANLSSLREDSLEVLAAATGVPHLVDLARRLQREVGSAKRMCYPDARLGSSIPAESYSAANVDVALDVATKTLDTVRSNMAL